MNLTKISQKLKNKSLLSIEKNIIKWEKWLIIIIKKYFNLKNFASYKGEYKKLSCLYLKSSNWTNFFKKGFWNVVFEGTIFKKIFLECISSGSNI